jgi:hypothetical protein
MKTLSGLLLLNMVSSCAKDIKKSCRMAGFFMISLDVKAESLLYIRVEPHHIDLPSLQPDAPNEYVF